MSPGQPDDHAERIIDGIIQRGELTSSLAGDRSELLTILVADIRGYTRFTQEHGDEAAEKLTAKFADVVRDLVAQFGGAVFELRGDEALCLFSSPRQCLRVAVAMQQRFVQETVDDASVPMTVGIGIDAGEAVRGPDGFRGGALNVAARLCGHARAGDVLASPELTHLAGRIDGIRYEVLDRIALKGLSERVRPVRVVPDGDDPRLQIAALLAAANAPLRPPPALGWLPAPLASRPRTTLAGLLAVLTVVGVAVGVTVTRSGSRPAALGESSVGILDPATGDILGHVDVAGGPAALAAGYGSMWTTDTDADTVTRIDMASHRIVHAIDVDTAPSAIAVGLGSVWVVNSASGTVSRINPSTNQAESITVGATPRGIVAAHGSVWVTNSGDGTVSRIDPNQNLAVDVIPVGFGPSGISAGRDIWVANSASNSVTEFDPTSPRQTKTFQAGTSPTGVTVLGDQVWVTNKLGGTVTRIPIDGTSDPETSGVGDEPSQIAAVSGHVWLASQATGVIAELDPTSGQVEDTVPIGPIPAGMAAGDGNLWVSTTIDPARHRGRTLNLAGGDVQSVDPIYGPVFSTIDTGAFWLLLNGSYDGLVAFSHTTGAGSTAVVPDLAASIPTPTDGGRTYTFTLRSDIRWSTGQPVSVDDVRRGIERTLALLQPSGETPLAHQIVGSKNCKPRHCALSGIAVDTANRTVTIKLVKPNGNFIDDLVGAIAVPASTPLAKDDTHPIPATGPYQIASFTPGQTLVFTRNPYFHEWSAAAQPAGFPDSIVWRVDPNADRDANKPAVNDVAAARADWADARFAAPIGTIHARFANRVHVTPTQTVHALSLNTQIPPFDKVKVRRALAFALDRQAIHDDWFVPGTITCQILPPDYSAYRPYCPYTLDRSRTDETWHHPDVSTALRLVRESHTRGMSVTVYALPASAAAFAHVIDALVAVGYDAHLKVYDGKQNYYQYMADSRNKVQAAFYGGITSDATAANLLDSWRCDAYKPADPINNIDPAGFCDPKYDRILDRARQVESTSLAAATELWAKADHRLTDKAPWLPLMTSTWVDVVSTRVRSYERSPVLGMLFDQMRLR